MMTFHLNKLAAIVLSFVAFLPIYAGRAQNFIQMGSKAPPVALSGWIKGKPVKVHPGTNVYVLIFCELTRAGTFALTNFSALNEHYRDKGVVTAVIGEESAAAIKQFVEVHGDEMDFNVAADGLANRTLKGFQQFSRQNMLPQAYVIDREGEVVWWGHPLTDGIGSILDQILSGTYNLDKAERNIISREQMKEYLALARNGDPQAAKAGHILLTMRTNDAAALCDLAFRIATDSYIQNRDTAVAKAALDRAAQISTTNTASIAVDRAILLFQTGHQQEGMDLARKALANAQTDDDKVYISGNLRAMERRRMLETSNASPAAGGTTNLPGGTH